MTDTNNGWPGKPGVPMNPGLPGAHWLKGCTEDAWMYDGDGGWWGPGYSHKLDAETVAARYSYLGPCLTPDEATALQARISELEVENAGLSANQCLHDIHGDESGNLYCPRIAELEAAIYQYVNHVVSYEGISFIDEMNEPPWAKLINDTWVKQAALEGGKS